MDDPTHPFPFVLVPAASLEDAVVVAPHADAAESDVSVIALPTGEPAKTAE